LVGFGATFPKGGRWGIIFLRYSIHIMSIVALKRNSRRFLVPVSANGFSLNGGYRNQRAIGNTNLSALTNSASNSFCSANDPAVVKLSTKNTKGFLYSTVNYPTCPSGSKVAPLTSQANWVKNFSAENRSAGVYTTDVKHASSAVCVTEKMDSGKNHPCFPDCPARSYHIGGKRFYTTYNAKNSGEYGQGAISAGEYLKAGLLKNKKYNCNTTVKSIAPIPKALLNGTCSSA
jgi:hypothetical protein